MKLKEQIIEEYSKLSDEQLAQLSEEERQELVSILESPDEEWQPEQNYAPTLSEMEEAKADAKTKYVQEIKRMGIQPSAEPDETEVGIPFTDASIDVPAQAMSSGWVGGIPFLKDAVSAYEGIAENMEEGGSFEEGYARYEDKLDRASKDLKAVEHHAPMAYMAGEIGATAATMAAGSAALKGAGGFAWGLTAEEMQMGSAIATGAASYYSNSEQRSMQDALVGGAMGYGGEKVGRVAGKVVKRGGKYLRDKADDIYASATRKILGVDSAVHSRKLSKLLKQHNMKESEFLSRILTKKLKDSDEYVLNIGKDTPDRMLDHVELYLKQRGKELGGLYDEVDAKFDVKVDVDAMKQDIMDDVVGPMLKSDDPDWQDIGMNLSKYIERIGTKPNGAKKEITVEGTKLIEEFVPDTDWNISRMHKLQVKIRDRIAKLFDAKKVPADASKEQQRKVATKLGQQIDEILEAASVKNEEGVHYLNKVKDARKDFSSFSLIKESLEDSIHRKSNDPLQALKEAISFKSLLAGGIASKYVGAPGMLVGPAFSRMMNDPNTPVYLSKGMEGIAKTMQEVPTGRIATRIRSAALMNSGMFEDTLYGIVAEQNLKANRIPRSTETIRDHVEDIRHYLRSTDREMFRQFDTLLESGDQDALGAFLDGVSKAPGANQFFEEGIGFNGKAYDEADVTGLIHQLKSTDMPASQRQEMLDNLRSNKIIPDFNTIVQPQPVKHQPRTKKLKDY